MLVNKPGDSKKEMELIPIGDHDALVHAVIDLGIHSNEFQGEKKPDANRIFFVFEIPGVVRSDGETQTIGYKNAYKGIAVSLHENSNLMPLASTLLGKTDDLADILGKADGGQVFLGNSCVLTIDHFKTDDGQAIHYIKAIGKLDPRLPQPKAVRETFLFDFITATQEGYDVLTRRVKVMLSEAINYSEITSKVKVDDMDDKKAKPNDKPIGKQDIPF